MKTAIILSLLSFLFHIQTNAQNTIEGRVTDKVTRQPFGICYRHFATGRGWQYHQLYFDRC